MNSACSSRVFWYLGCEYEKRRRWMGGEFRMFGAGQSMQRTTSYLTRMRRSNHNGDNRYCEAGSQRFYPESPYVRRTYWTAPTPHRSGRARFTAAARGEKVSATLATGKGLPRELLGTTRLRQRLAARC